MLYNYRTIGLALAIILGWPAQIQATYQPLGSHQRDTKDITSTGSIFGVSSVGC